MRSVFALTLVVLVGAVVAAPTLEKRGACTCASNTYSAGTVNTAINTAVTTGGGNYPHVYNNYEGFTTFQCPGKPFYEYPLKQTPYTGGSPGADRVIYDNEENFCGCITHTGAAGNAFVECDF